MSFINSSQNYDIMLLGVTYIFFVIIVVNGIIVKKTDQILQKVDSNMSKGKFISLIYKELWIVPLILIVYFILFLGLIYTIQFIIFILLKTERAPCLSSENQSDGSKKEQDNDFFNYIKKTIPIFLKSLTLVLILCNIFVIPFIIIFMIVLKKKEKKSDDSEINFNNSFINNIMVFYKNAIIILAFFSFYYFVL